MVTRYSPRFTCAALASLWARAAPGSSRAAASRIKRARLMSWLLLLQLGFLADRFRLRDPSVDERDRFLIGERGAERRHLQGRIARRDALHDAAALRVAGLDAQHRFGRLARRRLPHGLTDGACDRRRNARAGGLAQEKSDVLQRPLRVVTVAAVAVEIAEGGALGRRGRRDARRLVQERLRRARDQPLLDEIREIDAGGVGMQRAGIAVGRELQRAEAQNLAAAALMAGLAVADPGDGVRTPAAERVGAAPAPLGDELRVGALGVPGVGGIEPLAVGLELDEARLDAPPAEGELLPQARADRKTQASGSETSMALPGGSDIQRRLAAP